MSDRLAAAALALALAGCAGGGGEERAGEILAEARRELAPDRRTVVFDVRPEVRGRFLTLRGEIHDAELKERLLRMIRDTGEFEPVDSLTTLPDPALGDRTVGLVSVSVANLRQKPGHAQEMGTQALLGTPLKILKKDGGWLYVQTPDGYLCWTDDMIEEMDPTAHAAWHARRRVIVTATVGFVHSAASLASRPVSDVVAGCILGLERQTGPFYEVVYPDGRTGFLERSKAEPLDSWLERAEATPETIVATAARFMGIPYLWGGTSTKGMDCSGFTKTVYMLNGIQLPRDASQQVRVGLPVETAGGFDDVRPGDLLFFGRRAGGDRPERVTHVGISLGGARFIHSSGDVRVNSLNPDDEDYSEYRHRSFLRVKRIIGAPEEHGLQRLVSMAQYHGDAE